MSKYQSQIREVINRQFVVALALEQGFNAFLPVYDGGVDFIIHREAQPDRPWTTTDTRKVQLKGRWTIAMKYLRRDIWIAFPIGEDWHLIPHDVMHGFVAENTTALNSKSWQEGGVYSWPNPSKAMQEFAIPYRFAPVARVASEAATEIES